MNGVTVNKVGCLARYNSNFGDTITLTNVKVTGGHVCRAFNGRKDGKEPTAVGYRCDTFMWSPPTRRAAFSTVIVVPWTMPCGPIYI